MFSWSNQYCQVQLASYAGQPIQVGKFTISNGSAQYYGCLTLVGTDPPQSWCSTPSTSGGPAFTDGSVQPAGQQVGVARLPGGQQIDLFVRGVDGVTYHASLANGDVNPSWSDALQGHFKGTSGPAWNRTSPPSELDALGIGLDNNPWQNKYAGSWSLVGPLRTDVASGALPIENATAARRPNSTALDVFIRGADGAAYHACMCDGVTLGPWESLGGVLAGPPVASWRNDGTSLDAFAIGADNHPYEDSYQYCQSCGQFVWSSWSLPLPGTVLQMSSEEIGVARVQTGTGSAAYRLDLFVVGTDGHAWWNTMADGVNLGTWQDLGGLFRGAPNAAWDSNAPSNNGRLDVFGVGLDDTPYRRSYQAGGWSSSWTQLNGLVG